MTRAIIIIMLCLALTMSLLGCSSSKQNKTVVEFDATADFETIIDQARGTKVTFYGWGGDENRNKWLMETVAKKLKDTYDITLELIPMDMNVILSMLSNEKQAGSKKGTIDMIWINGENFFTARENDLLFGPFTEYLPSYKQFMDADSTENKSDFGYPIEGYEAPYGKAQLVMINDSARTFETPVNAQELRAYVEKYKGQVTYPALPDFTGSAFVRNIIYEICGYEQFIEMKPDKEIVRQAVMPAMEYLRSLNPYLWNQGKTFPSSSSEVENMFSDGELVLNMSYSPYITTINMKKGIYPVTVQTFLFDKGTIGNTNYIAIAKDAPNKAGAMVAVNYILSPEGQASQYKELLTLPVVDTNKLSMEQKALFAAVDVGQGTLSLDELMEKRLPEMPAQLIPIIEEIWMEEVVGK